jgi:uncharacterized protein involved in exopolysaccharide biosynthesis
MRKRALQRLTSPPEILYAFSRHWMLITGLSAFGTLVMMAKVSTDTPLYEGKASLSLNTDESIVVEHSRGGDGMARDREQVFSARVALFTSDTVLRRLVQSLKAPNLLAQDENPEEPTYGPVRKLVSQVKRRIREFLLYLEHPRIQDYGEEHEIQRAVAAFRHRSEVVPNPRTSTVQIRVYGTNRELLAKELEQWIDAYIGRLLDMSRETRDYYLGDRMRYWQELERNALQALEDFRRENPDLSTSAQDLLLQETMRLQIRKEEIERQIHLGGLPLETPGKALALNPEVEDLLSQKRQLEADRRKMLPHFPPESDRLRSINENIRLVEDRLREILGLSATGGVEDKPKLEEQVASLTAAIAQAMTQHNALASRLDVLEDLEDEYKVAKQTRKNYEFMSHAELDRRESTKFVQATVTERPQVAWLPYETYPYRQILYGGLMGLFAGCLLALLLELLRGTVRFKSDVETDLPVRVIGVIPLR